MANEKTKSGRPANWKQYSQTTKAQVSLFSLTKRLAGANWFKTVTLGLCAGLTVMVLVDKYYPNEDWKVRDIEMDVKQLLERKKEQSEDLES